MRIAEESLQALQTSLVTFLKDHPPSLSMVQIYNRIRIVDKDLHYFSATIGYYHES